MKFIHLTDPHLVTPGRRLHGLDPAARLQACLADIAGAHRDAAFCVLTGDVADRGEAAAYQRVDALLRELPMPVHVLAGNHDDRAALCAGLAMAETDGNGFVQSAHRYGPGHYLMLDTLEPRLDSSGGYCEQRFAWLAARLDEAGDAPVYLFMHHPPFDIGLPDLDAIGFTEKRRFGELLRGRANVRHIFFGHVHRPVSGQWRGIGFSTLYATNHQVRFDLAGGRRELAFTTEPPAYCVVLVDDDQVTVHTHHYTQDQHDIRDP